MARGLTGKILALHEALVAADLAHAFGGAFALAFCTAEPRATKDIDVNIFIGPEQLARLEAALPADVPVTSSHRAELRRDSQTRLWWDETPVDVFLSDHPFHDQAAANRRVVPFAGSWVPVLACADLAVFKTFFARPKDVLDVATMVAAGAIDLVQLESTVTALLGGAERADFLAQVAALSSSLE